MATTPYGPTTQTPLTDHDRRLPRVLFVDDEPLQLAAIQRSLRGTAVVTTAASAADAMRYLTKSDPGIEVVVADLRMPGTDGVELLSQIRQHSPSIPGILLTGHADLESAIAAVNQRAIFRYLTKPCPPGQLADAITAAAQLYRQRHRALRACLSELEATRRQALRDRRSRARFLTELVHELRTPLAAIIGFADLLAGSDLPDPDQQAVQRILDAGRHLEALTADLHQTGVGTDHQPAPADIDVAPVLAEAVDLVRVLADQRDVHLPHPRALAGCRVRADATKLRQVLVNLLTNAVKYNRIGGTITFTHGRDGDTAWIDVTDTGHGIPVEQLPRTFVPFDRLGAEHTSIEGTGIGLPLARDHVEAMQGTVKVARTSPQGTTFRLTLPVAARAARLP